MDLCVSVPFCLKPTTCFTHFNVRHALCVVANSEWSQKFQGQFVKITLNDGTLKFGQLLDADESNILVSYLVLDIQWTKYWPSTSNPTSMSGRVGEKTSVSLGVLGAADFFGELDKPLALGFINVTRGDDNKNITFNVGCTNTAFGPDWPQYYSPGAPSDNDWGTTYYTPESRYLPYPRVLMLNISGMVPLTERRWLTSTEFTPATILFGLRRRLGSPSLWNSD